MLDVAGERIARAAVPCRRNETKSRVAAKPTPGHYGILRGVREIVDRALSERRSGRQQANRGAGSRRVFPLRWGYGTGASFTCVRTVSVACDLSRVAAGYVS